jgi:tRNA(Ile)-lysidine synthase
VALTLLLTELCSTGGFQVVSLAHLNHTLRATADRDEQFCRDLAGRLGVPIVVERQDVRTSARLQRRSLEDAARRVRYGFLARAAAAVQADCIAVAHTQDDQAETFLLKLMRGAGSTGLSAIHPRRGAIVRPLLDVSRADLERFLRTAGQSWVEDETNQELDTPRNRIRHLVLPELDRTYGGPTRPAIARAASLVREDAAWLDALAADSFRRMADTGGGALAIDAVALLAEPLPLRRRLALLALRQVCGEREVGFGHVETALEVAAGICRAADVPGGRVERRRRNVVFTGRGAASPDAEDPCPPVQIGRRASGEGDTLT